MSSRARALIVVALLAALTAGCGQTGPLELPESARPIERVPPAQPDPTEDERQDER